MYKSVITPPPIWMEFLGAEESLENRFITLDEASVTTGHA